MRIPMLLVDFYKIIHHNCYKEGMTKLYSYWTPRMSRVEGVNSVVMFGMQGFTKKYLIEVFNDNFFNQPLEKVIEDYKRVIGNTFGENYAGTEHIEKLHKLGYLPIRIKAVPEGTLVPIGVPMFEIKNTKKDFAWLVNYLETLVSCHVWQPMTSATIAHEFRKVIENYYEKTVGSTSSIMVNNHNGVLEEAHIRGFEFMDTNRDFACGDFSMRGMSSLESSESSGAGHLLSFKSTANIHSILWLEDYYNCNIETEDVGFGTPSTEHSVMSSYGKDGEDDAYRRLITELYPSGKLSIVSDTYDYWRVLGETLPSLKEEIMSRDGKIIIRPDSGDPIQIICGTSEIEDLSKIEYIKSLEDCMAYMKDDLEEQVREETPHGECGECDSMGYFKYGGKVYKITVEFDWNRYDKQYYFIDDCKVSSCVEVTLNAEQKGTVQVLWETFGGYINDKGYKVLHKNIGVIYGDSITLGRCKEICRRLEQNGFATSNIVFGVGSFTYQYNTRDTFSFALKATHAVIGGEEVQIFKEPITDTGNFKKSQKGRCVVYKEDGIIKLQDKLNNIEADNFKGNLLETVFEDSKIMKEYSLSEIRETLNSEFSTVNK